MDSGEAHTMSDNTDAKFLAELSRTEMFTIEPAVRQRLFNISARLRTGGDKTRTMEAGLLAAQNAARRYGEELSTGQRIEGYLANVEYGPRSWLFTTDDLSGNDHWARVTVLHTHGDHDGK